MTMASKPCPNPHKKNHPTKRQAQHALWKAWRYGRGGKLPIRIYPCRCGHWHLTSKEWNP